MYESKGQNNIVDSGAANFNRLAGQSGMTMRKCADCAPSHREIVYQRLNGKGMPGGGYGDVFIF